MWESIQYAQNQGCTSYVTMGAAGNKRLHAYYAAKFNPHLQVRYVATKKSFLSGMLEKGYTNVIRPFHGKVKHFIS